MTASVPETLGDVIERWMPDLVPARARWREALEGAETVAPPASGTPYTTRTTGTGLDRRIRTLFALDPLPTAVPDPPPWHPRNLWGFNDVMDEEEFTAWRAEAPDRQATAQARYERALARHAGSSVTVCRPICASEPDSPYGFTPAGPKLIADLDRMTTMAVAHLLPPFAGVPRARRCVDAMKLSGLFLYSPPDLILGPTLVEIKATPKTTLERRWARQLLAQWLWDVDDAFEIREFAIYAARHGRLVRFEVGELFAGGNDPVAREAARTQVRPFVEEAREERWRRRPGRVRTMVS